MSDKIKSYTELENYSFIKAKTPESNEKSNIVATTEWVWNNFASKSELNFTELKGLQIVQSKSGEFDTLKIKNEILIKDQKENEFSLKGNSSGGLLIKVEKEVNAFDSILKIQDINGDVLFDLQKREELFINVRDVIININGEQIKLINEKNLHEYFEDTSSLKFSVSPTYRISGNVQVHSTNTILMEVTSNGIQSKLKYDPNYFTENENGLALNTIYFTGLYYSKEEADERFVHKTGDVINGDLTINGNLIINGEQTIIDTTQLQIEDNIITLNSNVTEGSPSLNAGIEVLRGDEIKAQIIWDENEDCWKVGLEGSLDRIITLKEYLNRALPHPPIQIIRSGETLIFDLLYDNATLSVVNGRLTLNNGFLDSHYAKIDLTNVSDSIILNKLKNVDGHNSGLDADTLDGKHASMLANSDLSNVSNSVILEKIKNVDGSGSGLDADKLDGLDSSQFVRSDQDDVLNGNYTFNGNIKIVGKSIILSSSGQDDVAIKANGENFIIYEPEDANKEWLKITDDGWIYVFGKALAKNDLSNVSDSTILNKLKNVDGSGSGLDADTLDGLNSSRFFRTNIDVSISQWNPHPEWTLIGGIEVPTQNNDVYISIHQAGSPPGHKCHLVIDGDVYANEGQKQLAYNDLSNVDPNVLKRLQVLKFREEREIQAYSYIEYNLSDVVNSPNVSFRDCFISVRVKDTDSNSNSYNFWINAEAVSTIAINDSGDKLRIYNNHSEDLNFEILIIY